ncbi:MAG: FIST C-terminal domain-containing protein [Magnetococcales bacterium]|nr:FIST C-terminal domain-containing protein [Magnetococcales bacterium]
MTTHVGIGFSEDTDSLAAGVEAVQVAMEQLGSNDVSQALLFSTSRHDPILIAQGIKSEIGNNVPIIGGYAVGVITSEDLGYDGYQVGIILISSKSTKFDLFKVDGLHDNELACGEDLGKQIMNSLPENGDQGLMLFYDSVNREGKHLKLNMAVPLLKGISKHLDESVMQNLVGAGLVGDMSCNSTWQWYNNEINQGSAMALMLSGGLTMHTTVLHGCRPASDYHTITKAESSTVFEINNRPALEVISELLGKDNDVPWKEYSFFVTLGVNQGEKYAPFQEENYQNRLCLRADIKRKAMVMFEPDLVAGSEFQLMRRSVDFSYISERVEELFENIPEGKTPVFAFYIDCAGRAAAYCGADEEDAGAVIEAIDGRVPLLGIYSGVEIGPIGGRPQSLDWTGVLTLFCE